MNFKIVGIVAIPVIVILGLVFYFYTIGIIPVDSFLIKDNIQTSNETEINIDTSKVAFTCEDNQNKNVGCYEKYYKALVKNFGVSVAFAELKKHRASDVYIKENCHGLTHSIGNAAVDTYATIAEAYKYGDNFCSSGYYHGVLEGVVKKNNGDLASQVDTICQDVPGKEKYSAAYHNCVHGLGHGVMAYSDNELFDALQLCDILNGRWERDSCYTGVFMENVIIDQKNHFTKYLQSDDLVYPCNAVEKKYKRSCYLTQTSYIFKASDYHFDKVFNICSNVDSNFKNTCYQSLGRDAAEYSIQDGSNEISSAKDICNLGKTFEQKSNCIIGLVKQFVYYDHSLNRAIQLCNSLGKDFVLPEICLMTARDYYRTF